MISLPSASPSSLFFSVTASAFSSLPLFSAGLSSELFFSVSLTGSDSSAFAVSVSSVDADFSSGVSLFESTSFVFAFVSLFSGLSASVVVTASSVTGWSFGSSGVLLVSGSAALDLEDWRLGALEGVLFAAAAAFLALAENSILIC